MSEAGVGCHLLAMAAAETSQASSLLLSVAIVLVVCGAIGAFVWHRQRQPFRSGEVERVGWQVVARDEAWDHELGRRYFVLSVSSTGLLAAGVLLVSLGTSWGVIPAGASFAMFLLAFRTLGKARGISPAAARVSGPRLRLPIVMARQHEAGTWWERWAWVDAAVLVATLVAMWILT